MNTIKPAWPEQIQDTHERDYIAPCVSNLKKYKPMKRMLIFLSLIPVLGISQPVTDGLVGYWPFNGNANDESGNSKHGTVIGASLTFDRFGSTNGAYEFDGDDDYIEIANLTTINNAQNQFSISIWATMNDYMNGSYPLILTKWETGIDREIALGFDDLEEKLYAATYDEMKDSKSHILSAYRPSLGEWFHLVFVFDGSTGFIYVNGNLSGSRTGDYLPNNISVIIGNTISLTNDWNGSIDDIYIFNRVITESEITSLYYEKSNLASCRNIFCDGKNVGIGTSDTKGYKLAVAGNIIAEEVKVALQSNWPDFVFGEDYRLSDLPSLEKYIKTNKHLPNIPKAEIVAKEGYNLGEMDSKLLRKIEELTLYLIEHNKRIDQLERKNAELEKELNILKAEGNE